MYNVFEAKRDKASSSHFFSLGLGHLFRCTLGIIFIFFVCQHTLTQYCLLHLILLALSKFIQFNVTSFLWVKHIIFFFNMRQHRKQASAVLRQNVISDMSQKRWVHTLRSHSAHGVKHANGGGTSPLSMYILSCRGLILQIVYQPRNVVRSMAGKV